MGFARFLRCLGFSLSTYTFSLVSRFTLLLLAASIPAAGQSILGGCLYSLDPSAQQAFFITGNTSVSAGCSVVVESNDSSAFVIGGRQTLSLGNHAKVGVVGGWQLHGNSIVDTMSNQQVQPVTISNPGDPLKSVTPPTQGTIVSPAPTTYDQANPPPNNTLSPGVYCGGLTIGNTKGTQYTMSPGTYIMAGGGFTLTSLADVAGSGVTIYNTSSAGWGCSDNYKYTPIDIGAQANLALSAPNSGPLAGVVMFGDRNGCASPGRCVDMINGKATATFTGNLYFPSDQLSFDGTSSTSGCMGAVADEIVVNGNSTLKIPGCSVIPITVSVTPQSIALYANQQQQFTAAVTNTYNTAVTWSISPASGSIDAATGMYTAPASISTPQTVTVTATSQADPNVSGSTSFILFPPVTVAVAPPTALLYQGQTQQFVTAVGNALNTAVTWTVSPAGAGTVDGMGLYTAPASITTQQIATVIATSVVDTTKSASASITLMPPIKVSVAPQSAKLFAGKTQQFAATVINTSNTAVTWSISPAGVGVIDSTGLYTAPASIATQQTITITATSQADSTKSDSATVSLEACNTNGYGYVRAIVIDHNQIPNTDQANFPFLFNSTDPKFATTANGGHVTNPNGYDIFFASDPEGQTRLDYEMEEYNPVTGQVIAWIRIPTLSHTSDTVVYLFYGNSNINVSQQNPTGVWDSNYMGVWHVPNGTQLSLADSSRFANSGTNNGATATAGQIDGGMSTGGGTHANIGTPANLTNLAQGNATFSAWVKPDWNGGTIMSKEAPNGSHAGWTLAVSGRWVYFESIYSNGYLSLWSWGSLNPGTWNYVTVTLAGTATEGGTATIYINGVASYSVTGGASLGQSGDDSAQPAEFGNASYGWPLQGSTDEFRISNTIRSADWIAAEYANQNSPGSFYTLSTENVVVNPTSATLYALQTQQFTATVLNSCSNSVDWSISPAGNGTITANGLYTAPSSIMTPQTVAITATSQSDSTKSASATVNLLPPVVVTVNPGNITISDGGQTQQFTASLAYTNNTGVTWSISPADAGTIDPTGLYTAPPGIATQQVTVTATSQYDPTRSGSATITLSPASLPPPICTSNGYSFRRPIVIDHTEVPNTDQANFPLLFSSTDPAFATIVNGGHMVSFHANDLMFSTDSAGQNQLNYELEKYNPVTGQIIAWIRVPNVSHTTDTTLYMFYGNNAIATSQQNPSAVWDANHMGVWHVANGTQLSVADSTSNGDDAVNHGAIATAGQIDGGMWTSQQTYATIGAPANLANLAHGNATLSAWANPLWYGGMILGKGGPNKGGWTLGQNRQGELELIVYDAQGGNATSAIPLNSGWNFVAATISQIASNPGASQVTVYVNGLPVGSSVIQFTTPVDDTSSSAYLAYNDVGKFDNQVSYSIYGSEDEFRISNIARSPDWIAAEYNNQSSPSSFYQLYPEASAGVVPSVATLYASQSEQFTVVEGCSAEAVTWSMPAGSPGTLSSSGLYTAPASISAQQPITPTAASQTDGSIVGTATITLMPPIAISIAPTTVTLDFNQTQLFTATVANTNHTGVIWSVSPSNMGSISPTGLYTPPTYLQQLATVTITASSQIEPSLTASATVTLYPLAVTITPTTAILAANQTLHFNSSVQTAYSGCFGSSCVTWSLSPNSPGTIDPTYGTYTAPASIPAQQTVTVIGTGQADGAILSATATITLIPNPPSISIQPATVTLTGGQKQQYYATVANISSTAVTWSMSPEGYGTLSASGVYTAPPVVTSRQVITITAVSQASPSLTTSAVLTLAPDQCAAKLYGYERSILIDHTKIPSSDQANFPLYFAVTDPLLATTTNGGHMANPSGYDIQFSTDPAGYKTLDYKLETYNPATGQIAAWIRVPNLSHSSDTILYMFYGNAAITSPQQNPSGVWDSNYTAVYQFDNLQPGAVPDSTINGNAAWNNAAQQSAGAPGGAASFDGTSSFIELPNDFPSYPTSGNNGAIFNSTFAVWFKTAFSGVILGQVGGGVPGTYADGWVPALYIDTNGYLRANFFDLSNEQQIVSPVTYNDNQWHHAVLTFDTNSVQNSLGFYGSINSVISGVETLYLDGQVVGSQSGTIPTAYRSNYAYYLGTGFAESWPSAGNDWYSSNWFYFNGALDQVEISSIARSSDWVRSEYLNHSSPSTFFSLSPEAGSGGILNPPSLTLYGSQTQQFTVLGSDMCNAADTVWSMPAGSPGTLGSSGLYTAPATIDAQQTVTVTASTLGAGSTTHTAAITLMPPVAISVTPGLVTVPAGGAQQFNATVTNTSNTGVTWTVSPGGVGSVSSTGVYTAPAILNGQQTVNVIATSLADPTQSAAATITLGAPAPAVVTVTVNPPAATLYAGQTQQFTDNVINTADIAVTWSVSPAGVGTIDATGFYTAPAAIGSQQTVAITATSQADPTQSGSATINLAPTACTASGYGYTRQIVVDHTKVPNTDQAKFPFLFSTTDTLLATTANGGHVTSANAYDIIFSADPNGLTTLNYELEKYDPITGQVIAWVQIPYLSHTSDTVIYLFYGNPNVTTSQQNATGTWDASYQAVWHLADGTTLSANDSTANAHNGTITSATPTAGQIDGGASFNGSTSQITCGSNVPGFQFTSSQSFTDSAWINLTTGSKGWMSVLSNSRDVYPWHGLWIDGTNAVFGDSYNLWGPNFSLNNWHYLVAVQNGGYGRSLYLDGALVASDRYPQNSNGSGTCFIGNDSYGEAFQGSIDEVRIANVARSTDWVAAEYNNQSSPATFFALSSESTTGIAPNAVTLHANQSQQFAAPGLCSAGASFSLSAGAPGTLTPGGLYTAPATISQPQTLTVTATSQANPSQTASATVTLMPQVTIAVSPTSATLTENQTQLFTATVTNTSNPTVTWSVSPAGLGSIDQTGAYLAPSSITTQQTVTITAASQADPTKTASAMITLAPSTCASTGYGYQRVIVIDHTKVANTDQINYPFLFNSTDPDLATVDNGGHVVNPNGYDIFFSTDPNGHTRLDFEVEKYNPVTGQMAAWIRIPTLSHSSDTLIYVFYGNPAITASQANPTGVWDSNYQAVYHLGNLPSTDIVLDSTTHGNNASFASSLTSIPGQISGAASLDGVTGFMEIPSAAFPSYPTGVYSNIGVNTTWNNTTFSATYGIWFKTASWGGLLDQTAGDSCDVLLGICLSPSPEQPGVNPYGSWGSMLDINFDGQLEGRGVGPTTQTYNDNNWHYAAITFENGVNSLYADGKLVATGQQGTFGYEPLYAYFVGTEDIETDTSYLDSRPWWYLNGEIDEINVSNHARSADWIQTQYNNQSSPSTFYKFYAPNAVQVAPSSISLYAAQSEQFAVPATCDATIAWSLPGGSPGTLTATGLYTAPSVISSQQTVTVSAASLSNGASLGSALVTLLPPPQPLTLVASSPSPYQVGSSQSFTATVLDPQGNPQIGVAVNFTVAGVNETAASATTDANGTATFTYTGTNSGTDTVEATASVAGELLTSNALTAAWLTPPPAQAPTVTLLPQPSPGRGALVGAFTDNNGAVIEPIVIGLSARTFIVPTGATRLQLGIDDNYYEDNGGSGFVVAVNGAKVTVPPTAMPWKWQTGGLNNNYQYAINDGSDPVVAAANLVAGQGVTVAYQSGTVSTDFPIRPPVNANGEPGFIAGTQVFQGAYFPTLYTTRTSYPEGQPITVFAVVTDAAGTPIPNASVTLDVSGANPGQFQAMSDATGTVSFLYAGQYAGNDNLQAHAVLPSVGTLTSNQTEITWTNYPAPPPAGKLSLNYIVSVVNSQRFSSFARDASGNPLPNVNVGFYITGVDNFQTSVNTNDIGQAYYDYYHTQSGNYRVIAVDTVDRNVIVTAPYTGTWTVPTGSSTGTGGTITINISANTTVTMPNALQLKGTVTDSSGLTPTVTWTEVSGPGTVSFASPSQPITSATFSQIGTYVVQLSATDSVNSGWAQFTVTVVQASTASQSQGWIGAPAYGSAVSGVVPITLAPGISLASGTLSYMPVNNLNSVTVLNANVSGSGQIGALDTTMLANGSYWIQMQATDTNGKSQYSLVLVTVAGNYKPGRVTTTVTDLIVPSTGLAINIQRTYDSLNAATSSDFGYGWSLGINVDLVVDPSGNVTFTLGGQRRTFYFTPTRPYCGASGWGCVLFPYYYAAFTAEPGLHGTLTDSSQGCPLDMLVPNGSLWECQGGGQYDPPGYIYTDPNGTQYNISAGGNLQSITDRNGNGLTITPNGITSTTGLNVPFVRDSQNRITQITDPQGNVYSYAYDANGNLASVTYPNTQQPSTYTYDPNHLYLSGTDFRNNPLPSTGYYGPGDTDANGLPLNGRLHTVTDGVGETTSYAYDLSTNTTTVSHPPDASGNVGKTVMVYDSQGDLLSSTDPLGNATTNQYDPSFNLVSTTDPMGHTIKYTYDANGNKTSKTYPATATSTNTTSYTNYNLYSEPASTVDELGNVRTFNYDANYNPAGVTDSLGTLMSTIFNPNQTMQAGAIGYDITQNPGRASQFTYDASGNLVSKIDALGRTTSYTYNLLGQKVTMTEPVPSGSSAAAATTTYTYDAFGNLTQTSAPLGRVTSSTYDGNGNKLTDTDAHGNTTKYQYDALNRLIQTTYPDGSTSSKTYDFRGNVVTETDQGGHVTQHQYDLAGRQIGVTQAYGTSDASTTTYAYDAAGRKVSETDALGHTTDYTYDAAGNLIAVSGPKGNFQYAYDDARNRVSMTDGNGNTTKYQYDARKRLIVTTYPDGTTRNNAYDGPGNLISVTDQAGNVVQYAYDAANQLQTVVQANSPNTSANTTTIGYDADGNPITLQDANTHTTASSFDLVGELTAKTLPDGSLTETRQYDQNGNLTSLSHFNGVTTTYTYDSLNRLLSRVTPGEAPVSFTYTPTGKYATSTDASGTTTYSYDSMDRLVSKATPEGTLNYTYDAAGHVASIASSNANGASMSYTYDSLNRLSTVTDNRTGGVTNYSYDPASNVGTVTYPNGVQTLFHYDTLNRVVGVTTQQSGYIYQRGPTGNLTNALEMNGRTLNWSYDGIYRLTGETISLDPAKHNGSVGYGLDPVGNRQSETSTLAGVPSGSFGYNADDELSSESYDQNGNVLSSGGKSFSYDAENHLVAMNGSQAQIVYDAFGNRVAKTANGVTTRYLVEDDVNPTGYPQVFDELTGSVATRTYTYGLQRISETQAINNTWTTSFYGYDGFGSVRQLTNPAGTITDTYDYDAFGNKINSTGTTPNNYLYRGEQYDPDLGLHYLRARYYNPITGRFMSRDPENGKKTDPSSLHKYLYAQGDPVNGKDPSGREDLMEYAGILTDKVNQYNTGNGPNRFGQCLAKAYSEESTDLSDAISGGSLSYSGQQIGQQIGDCIVDFLERIISPVPSSPKY